MPLSIELAKDTFSAGEVSAELRGRDDLAKVQTGLWFLENMVVLLEGGVTRRPGTRMIMPMKDPARISAAIPFRFAGNGSNAYLIVFNAGVIRWILANGVVQAGGGGNYEVAHPYTDADLGGPGAVTPGVSLLRYTASGNVIFLFCDGHQPQTLTRNADNSWTLAPYIPQGGPVDPVNLNPAVTIGVSATTGNGVALTGTGTNFQAGNVGGVWRLDESTLALIPEWTANEAITVPTTELPAATGNIGSLTNLASAFDENTGTEATQANLAAGVSFYAGQTFAAGQAIISATISDAVDYIAFNTAAVGVPAWNGGTTYFGGDKVTRAGSIYQANFGQSGQDPAATSGFWTNIGPVAFTAVVSLYAKNGVPANATDGTLLGTASVGAALTYSATIQSSDAVSTWTNIWIAGVVAGGQANIGVGEIDLFQFSGGGAAVLRRWNGNVYQAIASGNSGANPPVHSSGAVLSGVGGVTWLYRHRDRGFVQITAVTSATAATANVLERVPDSVLASPTAVWWPAAWDGVKGWPNRARLARNALVTARQGKFWRTQPGSFFNYDIVDPTNASQAIATQLVGEGSQVNIEWLFQGSYLIAGARDDEWVLAGQNPFAPLSVANLDPYPSKNEGSAVHIPAACEGGIAFIGRSRDRLHHATVDFGGVSPQILEEELTLTARHILKAGALGISHQRDPLRVNWIWCADGALVSETLMRPQQINGWARHPLVNGAIEWVVTIPSTDEGVSWTYLGTRRVINGITARFVELLQPFFGLNSPQATAAGAWYVDCGLQYVGAPITTITGLDHLNGQAVNVHADGAMYFNLDGSRPIVGPVAGGVGIVMTRPTQNAVIGLPINYRIRLLPFDFSDAKGATEGQRTRANHFFITVVNSAGGKIAGNPDAGGKAEPIEQLGTTGMLSYGAPVPLITNTVRTQGIMVPLDDQCVLEITGSSTMPFTLTGADPDVEVTENV